MRKDGIITPGDYRKHPAWFRTLNTLWRRAYMNGSGQPLDKDSLLLGARTATGLKDFGKDFWDEPLDRLIQSLNQEAGLHPIGIFISRKRIVNLLTVRLRAEALFKKYPGILDQEIYPPTLIVGLQRTGTTKLHRLMDADPVNRVLRSWEAIHPAPLKAAVNGRDKRIRYARISERALRLMAPGFFAIHPVEYSAPEEDILLLDATFLSTTPEATAHVPSYAAWLEKTDQSPAYEYGSRLLRLLQWQQPGQRWILKSPHHLEFLPLIEKYYGDPHLIWTHRELSECIPSFLSMVSHSRAIFSDRVALEEVTRHWVRKTSYMLQKGIDYRRNYDPVKITDVFYEELVGNAMGQLERIYAHYGGMDETLAGAFRMAEGENPKGKYGVHEYGLSDFGLSQTELHDRNREYVDLFNRLRQEQPSSNEKGDDGR